MKVYLLPFHSWESPFLLANAFSLSLSLLTVTQRWACALHHQHVQYSLDGEAAESHGPKWDAEGDQFF